jgi:hypothetical protein
MCACWSCLAINEHGAQVCPLCGADQTRPVRVPDSNLPPRTFKSLFHEWRLVIVIIAVGVGSMVGILWHNLGGYSISPALEAAGIAGKSLREVREALSAYALSENTYPATLDSLGDRVSLPMQTALNVGYKLQYSPRLRSQDGAYGGFVILARPEKGNYLSLYIDELGVVRATPGNQPARSQDPPL